MNPVDDRTMQHELDITDFLRKLVDEHSEAIALADEITQAAQNDDPAELMRWVHKVRVYNVERMEPHLQHEEQVILRTMLEQHPEHADLCMTIGKEHGALRTLAEQISSETAASDLANFGRLLKSHTLLEEQTLFPLVERLFNDEQKSMIVDFTPLTRRPPTPTKSSGASFNVDKYKQDWLDEIERFFQNAGQSGGSIVLLPRYNPDLVRQFANRLDLVFFDFQERVMAAYGQRAGDIDLEELDQSLLNEAQQNGIVAHNVEALLCVKTEDERREWFESFLAANWPNPVLVPITLYQGEVPEHHNRVCDLELLSMPRYVAPTDHPDQRIPYALEDRG